MRFIALVLPSGTATRKFRAVPIPSRSKLSAGYRRTGFSCFSPHRMAVIRLACASEGRLPSDSAACARRWAVYARIFFRSSAISAACILGDRVQRLGAQIRRPDEGVVQHHHSPAPVRHATRGIGLGPGKGMVKRHGAIEPGGGAGFTFGEQGACHKELAFRVAAATPALPPSSMIALSRQNHLAQERYFSQPAGESQRGFWLGPVTCGSIPASAPTGFPRWAELAVDDRQQGDAAPLG